MKRIIASLILVTLLITNLPVAFAGIGYDKSNIDSYVGQKIIDLNYYHSSKGYYPYKKRLDSSGNMQCVGYAYARLEEKLGLSPDFSSGAGAKDIPNNAPNGKTRTAIDGTVYTIEVYKNDGGSHITANSWVSFGPGSSSYGHVIYVEEVIGDTIYYSESGTSMWKKGTAGTLKKKSRNDFINNCSSGGTYVGTVVFRGENGGSYIEPTPVPTSPTGISLSSNTINLDYPNSTSQTITVTATGDLPSKYKFEISINSGLNHNWASSWSGSSINLTVSANQNSPSTSTATIYLKDSSNNSVCASINFNINVTKPIVKEYVKVSYDSMGGSTIYAAQTVEKYGTVTIPDRAPGRSGYTFLGWNTNPNATDGKYMSMQTISVGVEDITLYAIWQKNEASWDEWNLSVSDEELYFDSSSSPSQSVTIMLKEHDGKREGTEYDLRLNVGDELDYEWGDIWYNENGYKCYELIIYAPQKPLNREEVRVRLRDEEGNTVDSASLYVSLKENQELPFADRNKNGITVYLDGEKISFDVPPQIINGRTMVPMRAIFEALGAMVNWDNNTQTAFGETIENFVEISIGDNYLFRNGEKIILDSPAVVVSNRTLVPIRAIAESLNCFVDWDGELQVVNITKLGIQYTNDVVVGKWKCIGWVDDFEETEYTDNVSFTLEFNDNGTVLITNNKAKKLCDYKVTKGGYVIITDDEYNDYAVVCSSSPNFEELLLKEYHYNEFINDIYWETKSGSVILRKAYNYNGKNLIEDDDGYIFERVD